MKVKNLVGSNGREIPNQFIIEDENCEYFQSYESIIVKRGKINPLEAKRLGIEPGFHILLDRTYWAYSNTTSKYRNIFLRETKKRNSSKN
jgi:hypothetical protein